ncbi:bacterio-opsin activator domain-containing protein [Halobaculum litoreum]|uniref:Bacterio-opsin activator domain-containing protein n=1 Tax=Halobaculum litoreum TaxID=3031998 RepID=A0ABD5XRM9_9EURY
MGVHAAVTVRAREFALARTLAVAPSARVTLEPVVPFGAGFAPAVRIRADDPDLVTDLVAAEADVRAVEPIDRGDDEALLGVEWDDRPRPIPATVTDAGGQCTEAVAVDGSWHLGLRFPTHDHVAAWYGDCRDRGSPSPSSGFATTRPPTSATPAPSPTPSGRRSRRPSRRGSSRCRGR